MQESDSAEIKAQKAQFDLDIIRKEKQELIDRISQMTFDLN